MKKPKFLHVGDSFGPNIEFNKLEKAGKCRIRTVKAYSAVVNTNSKFPHKNVTDVTAAALNNTMNDDEYSGLVLSAPTVDITNLDTSKLSPGDNTEAFKQHILVSCQNMFTAAEQALDGHMNLKKVVILEHPPREDTRHSDPLGLKPQLANYANMIY